MRRAACVLLAIAGAAFGGTATAATQPLSASTSLSPRPAFFGERIVARAEIVLDKDVVDPASVRFAPSFEPYAVVGEPHASRTDAGSVATLGFVYMLECLDDSCLPGASIRTLSLRDATLAANTRSGRRVMLRVPWQTVFVAPRVTPSAAEGSPPRWRIQLALPEVSYRVNASIARSVAWLLAVLLACAGLALVAWELVRHRRIALARARALSALAQAIALVRESEGRPADDRRRALSLLSRVLAAHSNGDAHLADDVTRLAWDRPDPSPTRIEALLRDVEESYVSQ